MTEQEFRKLKVGDKIKYKYGNEIVLEKITSLNYDRIFSSPIDSNTIGNDASMAFTSDNWILVEQRLPIVGEMVKCEDEDGKFIGKIKAVRHNLFLDIDIYSCNEGFYNSAGFEHHNDSYWDGWTFNVNELKCIFDEDEKINHYGHRRSNDEYKSLFSPENTTASRKDMETAQKMANMVHNQFMDKVYLQENPPFTTTATITPNDQSYWFVNTMSSDGMSCTATIGDNKINNKSKLKTMCENITKFAQNLTLSTEDKLYRKVGLQDDNGSWKTEADKIILNKEAEDLGFKDYDDLCEKHGQDNYVSVFEWEALYTKHAEYLLGIAKDYAKSLNKNK